MYFYFLLMCAHTRVCVCVCVCLCYQKRVLDPQELELVAWWELGTNHRSSGSSASTLTDDPTLLPLKCHFFFFFLWGYWISMNAGWAIHEEQSNKLCSSILSVSFLLSSSHKIRLPALVSPSRQRFRKCKLNNLFSSPHFFGHVVSS